MLILVFLFSSFSCVFVLSLFRFDVFVWCIFSRMDAFYVGFCVFF
jgi:hypothetical protein